MKHLKSKREYDHAVNEQRPNASVLDTFPKPNFCTQVTLYGSENTSLCPITTQPDFWSVRIEYWPKDKCLESKSLKLYLMSFRSFGAFCEQLSSKICDDIYSILKCHVSVTVTFNSRGGVVIESTSEEAA